MWFIHFSFELVQKFEQVQTFQLIEINFPFVENVISWYYIVQLVGFKLSNSVIKIHQNG